VDLSVLNAKTDNPSPGDVFLPGFMVYFVFTLANGVASTLLGERQEGTLRRMLNAPISRFEILFGKLIARGVLGVMQTAMLIAIGVEWLHLSVAQAPFGILITALTTIFAACGLGLLMATFGKTMDQIQGMTTMFLLLLGFISGTLIPRAFLPDWMVKLSYVTPHAWALNAYQDLIQRHHTLISTLPNLGVVAIFGVVFFGIALARFRFE
jgi:ABC-2 type transport system permease protein